MRVLGLDPGSRRTGYGIVERHGNALRCLTHGHVSGHARADLPTRLLGIVQKIEEILDAFAPEQVALEEAFYHESVRSTLVLGHVRGALMVAAAARSIPIAEYSPREIKLSVAGHGGAAKEQVAFMVKRLLGLPGTLQPDAADALAVALCHLHRARLREPARAMTAAAKRLEALLQRKAVR